MNYYNCRKRHTLHLKQPFNGKSIFWLNPPKSLMFQKLCRRWSALRSCLVFPSSLWNQSFQNFRALYSNKAVWRTFQYGSPRRGKNAENVFHNSLPWYRVWRKYSETGKAEACSKKLKAWGQVLQSLHNDLNNTGEPRNRTKSIKGLLGRNGIGQWLHNGFVNMHYSGSIRP